MVNDASHSPLKDVFYWCVMLLMVAMMVLTWVYLQGGFYVGGYSWSYVVWYLLIRYLYFYVTYLLSVVCSTWVVFGYKRGATLRESLSKLLLFSVGLYPLVFLLFLMVKHILLEINFGIYLLVSVATGIGSLLLMWNSGQYALYRVEYQAITFKKKVFGKIGVLSWLLFRGCYRIISVVEIEELPREGLRHQQRPFATERYFRRMGVEDYQSEVSSYLKLADEGSAEIELNTASLGNLVVIARRYGIAEGRFYSSTSKRAIETRSYLHGALKSLPFTIKTRTLTAQECFKLFVSLRITGLRGRDKEVLELEASGDDWKYLGIICMRGAPEVDAFAKFSQNDRFIRSCLDFDAQVRFITNFQKGKLMEHKKRYIELDRQGAGLSSGRLHSLLEYPQERTEASDMVVGQIEGYPMVSAYVVIITRSEDSCRAYLREMQGILYSVYSGMHYAPEVLLLTGRSLKKAYRNSIVRKAVKPSQMSMMRLKALVHFPELPHGIGIDAQYIPEFELPFKTALADSSLAHPKGKGTLTLGYLMVGNERVQDLCINVESLRKSLTVFGRIGTGKTSLIKLILRELTQTASYIDFLIFDYKNELKEVIKTATEVVAKDITVYVPVSDYAPLHINLFNPMGRAIEEHVNELIGLFREVYSRMFTDFEELSPQMERILNDVLKQVVESPSLQQAGFEGFMLELVRYGKEHKKEFSFIDRTITALENRLRRFVEGSLGKIFNVRASNIDLENLLGKKLVINLSYMRSHGCTEEDARFLMNLLMLYYTRSAHKRGLQDYLRNIVIAEEAQYLVPELHRKVFSIDGTVTQRLPILLRAFGVGFILISTRPTIAEDVIENSYTKISFQLGRDAELLQKYMNLNEEQMKYLRRMRDREALFFSPEVAYPCRFRTLDYETVIVTEEEIYEHNKTYHPELYEVTTQVSLKEEARHLKKALCKQACEAHRIEEMCSPLAQSANAVKSLVDFDDFLRIMRGLQNKSIPIGRLHAFLVTEVRKITKSKVNNPSLCLCSLIYLVTDYRVFTQFENSFLETIISAIAHLVREEHAQSLMPQKEEVSPDVEVENGKAEETSEGQEIVSRTDEQEPGQEQEAITKLNCSFCKDIEQHDCKQLFSEVERNLETLDDSTINVMKTHYTRVAFEVFCNYIFTSKYVQQKDNRPYLLCFMYNLLKRLNVPIEREEKLLYEKLSTILEWTMKRSKV